MKQLIVIILMLFTVDAFGASSRILPASYDEYTYDSAGGGEDYTTLTTWEADTDIDLVTAAKGKVLTCSSGVHNDSITLAGATTSASYFRVIRAASGARGTPTSGVRFEKSTTATTYMFWLSENNAAVYDIASKLTSSTNSVTNINFLCYEAYTATFVGCTSYASTSTGTLGQSHGFVVGFYKGGVFRLVNCVAMNHSATVYTAGFYARAYAAGASTTTYIYNCTSVGNDYGVWVNTVPGTVATLYLKNTIMQGNSINNLLSDGAGTEYVYNTTNATSGVTFSADGYHITNDLDAVNAGTDLSGDGTFPFDDDIDGDSRPAGAWDIGCDEYVATGTSWKPQIIIY